VYGLEIRIACEFPRSQVLYVGGNWGGKRGQE